MKKKLKLDAPHGFMQFLNEPIVAGALLVFALIALFLSILEFSAALS